MHMVFASQIKDEMKTDEELAEEKIREMFPLGYCIGGNYEGYKKAILEGIKIGKLNKKSWLNQKLDISSLLDDS